MLSPFTARNRRINVRGAQRFWGSVSFGHRSLWPRLSNCLLNQRACCRVATQGSGSCSQITQDLQDDYAPQCEWPRVPSRRPHPVDGQWTRVPVRRQRNLQCHRRPRAPWSSGNFRRTTLESVAHDVAVRRQGMPRRQRRPEYSGVRAMEARIIRTESRGAEACPTKAMQ